MADPKKWKGDRERIGVEGSLHRRILAECESVGLVLIDVRDLGHPSRETLVFLDDKFITEVTIEGVGLDGTRDPGPLTALAGLEMLFSREGESATDRFERVAEEFYRETGYMRPGKSQPDAMGGSPSDEERARAYEEWIQGKLRAARACMKEAAPRG